MVLVRRLVRLHGVLSRRFPLDDAPCTRVISDLRSVPAGVRCGVHADVLWGIGLQPEHRDVEHRGSVEHARYVLVLEFQRGCLEVEYGSSDGLAGRILQHNGLRPEHRRMEHG